MTAPAGLLEEIIEMRSYLKAKHLYETTKPADRPKTDMVNRVQEIEFAIAREHIEATQTARTDEPGD